MGVFIESLEESDFKRLLKMIKLKLFITEEDVMELYEKNQDLMKYVSQLIETESKINADGEEKNIWIALEDILLDIIVNGESQINILKEVAKNLQEL
jgi:Asp-tRNA(Asn)/Glu-tRNA(Gln) amidotransferase C subunit